MYPRSLLQLILQYPNDLMTDLLSNQEALIEAVARTKVVANEKEASKGKKEMRVVLAKADGVLQTGCDKATASSAEYILH